MKTFISTEFTSVENKADVRIKIIKALGLADWEVQGFFFNPLDVPNLPAKINYFVESFPLESKKLLDLSINGLGPGEILLYFLCDNLSLSGFKSHIDASVNGVPFAEVKAVLSAGPGRYCDFRFGVDASEPNHQFLFDVRNFVNHAGNPAMLENELEITRTKISELRQISIDTDEFYLNLKVLDGEIYAGPKRICKRSDIDFACKIQDALDNASNKTPNFFSEIEDRYFSQILDSQIGKQNFLLFDRKTAKCIYFGKISKEMLSIERVTQGKVKPFINLIN